MQDIDKYDKAGNAGATGLTESAPIGAGEIPPKSLKNRLAAAMRDVPPSVFGGVPPKFRQGLVESSLADSEFLRLPPPRGRDRLTGLSRTSLIELGERKAIKLIRVRKPNAMRGIVLIEKASLLSYLHGLAAEGESKGGAK